MLTIICIILGAALAAALAWVILLKRDIRQLSQKLSDISDIDTNAQLTTQTFDSDIATLTNSINKSLERSRRDLLDKARAEAALKRAITNISHDLRTPLTSALGYLQMLESSELDAQTKTRYTETIKGRLEALSDLMNNLFELTRIIEGSVTIDIQKVNICNTVRDTLSASFAELDGKGFTVETDIPDAPVMWMCDEDALRRALQNLIKNVCAHGKEYLRIDVKDTYISITNRAEGLDELDTQQIFERFYTADASRTSKNTGLGLAIAKELTERMGGSISASVNEDIFSVQIKLNSTDK